MAANPITSPGINDDRDTHTDGHVSYGVCHVAAGKAARFVRDQTQACIKPEPTTNRSRPGPGIGTFRDLPRSSAIVLIVPSILYRTLRACAT